MLLETTVKELVCVWAQYLRFAFLFQWISFNNNKIYQQKCVTYKIQNARTEFLVYGD